LIALVSTVAAAAWVEESVNLSVPEQQPQCCASTCAVYIQLLFAVILSVHIFDVSIVSVCHSIHHL